MFAGKISTSPALLLHASLALPDPLPNRYAGKGSGDMAIPKLFWWNAEVASIIS